MDKTKKLRFLGNCNFHYDCDPSSFRINDECFSPWIHHYFDKLNCWTLFSKFISNPNFSFWVFSRLVDNKRCRFVWPLHPYTFVIEESRSLEVVRPSESLTSFLSILRHTSILTNFQSVELINTYNAHSINHSHLPTRYDFWLFSFI
jgi:hypothetical protein